MRFCNLLFGFRAFVIILLSIFYTSVSAQELPVSPLNLPISFAGTYGELRHDHFHSGFDFRVGGKVGDPVHSIKSGYVSRISVSTTGYGNGLYINHYDGTTSVYGHLLCYSDNLASLVKKAQYEKKSYSVNLIFKEGEIPIAQGEIVGKVGSTGSSVAPHLHLEVRDTKTETPLNFIKRGYYIVNDDLSPVFRKINFYAHCDTLPIPLSGLMRSIKAPVSLSTPISLPHKSYIGIDAIDKQNGTPGRLAVEEYLVTLDGETIFHFKIGEIPFSHDRYIQSTIDYSQSYRGGNDVIKTYVEPGNLLSDRIESKNEGLIVLDDYNPHSLVITVSDIDGNSSSLKYKVVRDDSVGEGCIQKPDSISTMPMLWYAPNILINSEISFAVKATSLYNSLYFSYNKVADRDSVNGIWSDVWQMGSPDVPMHNPAFISIKANVPERLRDKATAAFYSDGKLSYAGGYWSGEGIFLKGRFGTYCVTIDTIAPVITFYERKGSIVTSSNEIIIPLKDNFSGIGKMDVTIDDEWVLFKYLRGRIVVTLDRERIAKGKHTIVVKVADRCSNEALATRTFTWK